jgi:prepilin-type N-terminal cleavage/methylation domain-containing protein
MYQKIRKQTQGFTIIEVLIVLAIAGLILLIVFIAVPALQRNARNTSRRNDISAILGAASEYANNNNGTLPTSTAFGNGKHAYFQPLTTSQMDIPMGYYDSNTSGATFTTATGDQTNGTNTDSLALVRGAVCDGPNADAGPGRSVVILFSVEGSGGSSIRQCQAS